MKLGKLVCSISESKKLSALTLTFAFVLYSQQCSQSYHDIFAKSDLLLADAVTSSCDMQVCIVALCSLNNFNSFQL